MQAKFLGWLDSTFGELFRQLRWSFLPPLLVYFAAGVAGLTGIVGAFFTKEYLGLSAAFLASLAFWAGIPWALKMPLGHLVDVIWRWKSLLIYVGALIIALSLSIVYGLIVHKDAMTQILHINTWFVISVLLAPIGYVIQDVVADAMTVEAVPKVDDSGVPLAEQDLKKMHVTMQTLGRIAIISGLIVVATLNITLFSDVEMMSETEKMNTYAAIYRIALAVPLISVLGVVLASIMKSQHKRSLARAGYSVEEISRLVSTKTEKTSPNFLIFGGSLIYATVTLSVGIVAIPFNQEIIFVLSMIIVIVLMNKLIGELDPNVRGQLWGTAVIIFIFRAVPLPGSGATWWEIDILRFDQQFLSVLTLITSLLALMGMLILRPMISKKSIAWVVVVLSIAAGLLSLPNIGLFYDLHHWTSAWSNGIIDARVIAVLDTALESPLAQIAMIPMLAWIARNAPQNLKATFFAVFASFTNLALSASSLGTKYLNQIFIVTREVHNPRSRDVSIPADYSELGFILITVGILVVLLPLVTVFLVQHSGWRTTE